MSWPYSIHRWDEWEDLRQPIEELSKEGNYKYWECRYLTSEMNIEEKE